PRGTTISFTFDAIRDGHLDRAVKAAALHFPLQVTYNDEPLPRVDFLKGAHAVLEREGYRIGVYKNVNLDHVPTINFHGLTLRHKLPSIKEVHHTLWRVKVDIIDAPELVLVLPARKEIYRNPALDRLMEIATDAIYSAISKEPFHRLAHKDWLAARLAGCGLPEAARQLPSWQGHCARDSYHEIAPYAEIDPTAAIYDDGDACDSVTFGRAIAFSHGDDRSIDSNRLIAPADITFFAAVPQYQGYSWYVALSCYAQTGVTHRQHDGSETACETDAVTFRPDVLTIELTDQHDKRLDLLSDFAIQEGENCWSGADEARIALTRTASIDPGDLTELIIDAVFSPSDDSDADSYDTQETRFRHDAAVRAHAILEGEDAAIIAGIRMAFADRVAWRIPHGRTLQLSWSHENTSLELRAASDAKPQ
ncbi:MAG TPA: ATP-binding protein, partial [Novosphingobium sp.]|nr:ATP-binding protein [Novosphingobium sp.]